MQIIIPMSGIGKRFQDAGYLDPKPLIEVDGRPMIYHVIDLFPGESRFHFICNDEHIQNTNMRDILLKKVPSAHIHEVSVKSRKGPVDAVLQIQQSISDSEECIVSYCDYGTVWNYSRFLEDMRSVKADGGIASYIGFHPHMLGSDNYAFMKHENMWVTDIQEKQPFTQNKMSEYASNGTYYFRSGNLMKKYFQDLVNRKMDLKGEYYVSLVYKLMCQDSLRVRIFEIEKMLQWGTPKDLEEYKTWADFFRKRIEKPLLPHSYPSVTTILPMAGAGSRFQMVGYEQPKPLLPVHGNPMFIEAVNCLPKSENIVFVCQKSHLNIYPIEQIVKDTWSGLTIPIDYVTDGQACTCEIAINEAKIPLENPILISACDNGVYYDVVKYNNLVNNKEIDVIVWAFTNNPTGQLYPHMYAWLDVDKEGRIHEVSIKKPFTNKPNTHAIIGTMFFRKGSLFMEGLQDIYRDNIRTNNEFYVDNVLQPLIEKGYRVQVFEVDYYLCWGTPNDYKTYLYWDEHFTKNAKLCFPRNENA
jgi:NDP-sugar pyrophosphorylase family protein